MNIKNCVHKHFYRLSIYFFEIHTQIQYIYMVISNDICLFLYLRDNPLLSL